MMSRMSFLRVLVSGGGGGGGPGLVVVLLRAPRGED